MKRWPLTLITLLTVLLLPAIPAWADDGPTGDGVVIVGKDYTVEADERIDGDLVLISGDLTIEEDSQVDGTVVVWNGSAEIEGHVEGDVVVSLGDITLGPGAEIQGNVVCSWNCDLERDDEAQVEGSITEGSSWQAFTPEFSPPPAPLDFLSSGLETLGRWIYRLARAVLSVLVLAVIAGLLAAVWPHQTSEVTRTVRGFPWVSAGIGLLTALAAFILVVALALTVCLAPLAILASLALGAAAVFGWISVGALLGDRLLRSLNVRGITPLWAAVSGTLVITLIVVMTDLTLSLIPCLKPLIWLVTLALGAAGLGAVILTRFGTVAYQPQAPATQTPTLSPTEPSAEVEPFDES